MVGRRLGKEAVLQDKAKKAKSAATGAPSWARKKWRLRMLQRGKAYRQPLRPLHKRQRAGSLAGPGPERGKAAAAAAAAGTERLKEDIEVIPDF